MVDVVAVEIRRQRTQPLGGVCRLRGTEPVEDRPQGWCVNAAGGFIEDQPLEPVRKQSEFGDRRNNAELDDIRRVLLRHEAGRVGVFSMHRPYGRVVRPWFASWDDDRAVADLDADGHKAIATVRDAGPENAVAFIQGKLEGGKVIDAGLTAQVKAPTGVEG
jgi:hypothetical protein